MKLKALLLISLLTGANIFSFAQIIHVPGDHSTVQDGIDAATVGDTVLVADGTYLENIRFMGKAITVASHFIMDGDTNHINNTILDGSQPSNPDEASVVSFLNGEDTTSIICGFTITGGTGMIDPKYGARIGGGIVSRYAGAKITHNKITGNSVTAANHAWGGGINCFMDTGDYWTILENNTITGNQSIAGSGWAEGGGVEISSNARVMNNTIVDNYCTSASGDADGGGLIHFSINLAMSLTLKNNQISNNTITSTNISRGGGVSIWFSECQILDNTINNNSSTGSITNGAGLFFKEPSTVTMRGNIIKENTVNTSNIYWGPGCMVVRPLGSIYLGENEFWNNEGPYNVNSGTGGGLALMDGENTSITINGNAFYGNQGASGGGFYARSCYNLTVINNFFTGNESVEGGAIKLYIPASTTDLRPVFINNTLLGNHAENRGGGAHLNCETNIPIFFNNIFYDNTAPTGSELSMVGNPQPIIISYSCIDTANVSGIWNGTNNINEDPLIIPLSGLGHLSSNSPCINSGVSSLTVGSNTYFAPDVDIEGEPRPDPVSDTFDMGADEYYPSPPVAHDPIDIGPDYFVAIWNEALWSQGYLLDVAYDNGFENMVPGYDNINVGSDTTYMVSGLMPSEYYFRVRTFYGSWISNNSNTIMVDIITGTSKPVNLNLTRNILLYPNPVKSTMYIKGSLASCGKVIINIYNSVGTILKSQQSTNQPNTLWEDAINLSDLPPGIYFVRVMSEDEIYTTKVIKR